MVDMERFEGMASCYSYGEVYGISTLQSLVPKHQKYFASPICWSQIRSQRGKKEIEKATLVIVS